jgi:hypothetical protein
MLRLAKPILLACAILACASAFAWPPTFGPEFTFYRGNREFDPHAMLKLVQLKLCVDGRCTARLNDTERGVRVSYDDGFWFEIHHDPKVVEVTARPGTVEETRRQRNRMQSDIFDFLGSLNYRPHARIGGGHLNMGLESAFGGDAMLLRNYIVDLLNHPELGNGVLRDRSPRVSPTYEGVPRELREQIQWAIARFDRSSVKSVDRLLSMLEEPMVRNLDGGPRNFVLAIYHAIHGDPKSRRLEHRGVGPQQDVDRYLLEIELLEARVEHLKTIETPIPLRRRRRLTPEESVRNFHEYVTQSKKEWSRFQPLITERLREETRDLIECLGKRVEETLK